MCHCIVFRINTHMYLNTMPCIHCFIARVAYASRGLKGGKLKYHSSKLEFLALKWAVTEQFREYLQYQPFLVRTDNNPHDDAQFGCRQT